MKEHKIPEKKMYDAMLAVFNWSTRGVKKKKIEGINFGYEALNDIYSFLRMFRTFKTKRKLPCKNGEQKNIIYISHLTHATGVWLLLKKLT